MQSHSAALEAEPRGNAGARNERSNSGSGSSQDQRQKWGLPPPQQPLQPLGGVAAPRGQHSRLREAGESWWEARGWWEATGWRDACGHPYRLYGHPYRLVDISAIMSDCSRSSNEADVLMPGRCSCMGAEGWGGGDEIAVGQLQKVSGSHAECIHIRRASSWLPRHNGRQQGCPDQTTARGAAGQQVCTWLVGMPSASAILCSSCATSMLPLSE